MTTSLTENYSGGGFGHSLQPGARPALVIVDFVMAYQTPGSPLYAGVEAARDACAVLLHAGARCRYCRAAHERAVPAGRS
jgi:maleamate amidohydrolase